MAKLWGRKYKIQIIEEKSGKAWDVSQLRCVFGVEKQLNSVSNISVLHVYNLSPQTESEIIKEANRLTIEAGYEAEEETTSNGKKTTKSLQYGKIYDGDIIQVIRTKDNNVDYDLCLVCLDGEGFLHQGHIAVSLAPSSSPRQIVQTLADKSNHPIKIEKVSDNLQKTKLPRGKVLFGQPRDYLKSIAFENNGTFWVEDNKLKLEKMVDPVETEAIEMTPQTGLIGYPNMTNQGVELKCLLDPRVKLRGLIKINNESVRLQKIAIGSPIVPLDKDGEYQVIKITHSGDTRGNDWYTSILAVNRAGMGAIPTLLENGKQSPFGGNNG